MPAGACLSRPCWRRPACGPAQPPGKGQAFWDAEVQKMIKVYHAPVDEADAKAIADYLAKTY